MSTTTLNESSAAAQIQSGALSKMERAALLVLSMGVEAAAQIFRNLNEEEIEQITLAITKLSNVPEGVRNEVLNEFAEQLSGASTGLSGGPLVAASLLTQAVGFEKAEEMLTHVRENEEKRGTPFGFLEGFDSCRIAHVLRSEHPQTIALVLSQLKPNRSSQILDQLPPGIQTQVVERIGSMNRISLSAIRRMEAVLHKQFTAAESEAPQNFAGAKAVAEMLSFAKKDSERRILEELQSSNEKLLEEVKRQMLTFEDLAKLPNDAVQTVLREVDMANLALSLKNAPENLKTLIFQNLSQRAAENLKDEIDLLPPKPRSEVRAAQDQVIATVRKLEEAGKITIARGAGGEDELV